MSGPLKLTDKNFEQEVISSAIPVLVDFWASWCPPCKMVEPVLSDLANMLEGKIKIAKINVDQNPESAHRFKVQGVPTFVFFINGTEIKRGIGAHSKEQLMSMMGKI